MGVIKAPASASAWRGPGVGWDMDGVKEAVSPYGVLAPQSFPRLPTAPRLPSAT